MIINIDIHLSIDDFHFMKRGKIAVLSPFNGVEDAVTYTFKFIKQMERETKTKFDIEKIIYEGTNDITKQVKQLFNQRKFYLVK